MIPKETHLKSKLSHFRINYLFCDFHHRFYGYPRLPRENVAKYKEAVEAPEDEFEQYFKLSRPDLTWQQKTLIISGILLVIKNIIFPHYVVSSTNSLILESVHRRAGTLHYGCLETNCTRPAQLRQLLRVPIFSVCHQRLCQVFPPVVGLQILGLSLHTFFLFYILLMQIYLILVLYLRPTGYESHIFLFAPNLSRMTRCEEIRRYLLAVHMSMENYFREEIAYSFPDETTDVQDSSTIVHYSKKEFVSSVAFDHEYEQIIRLRKHFKHLDRSAQAYITDCLTVFRERVWWEKYNRVCSRMSCVLFAAAFATLVGCVFWIDHMTGGVLRQTEQILDTLRATGCAIWLGDSPETGTDLALTRAQWNALSLAEVTIVTMMGALVIAVSISRYHIGICEINSMLAEQMDRIYMTIEVTKLLKEMDFGVAQSTPREGYYENLYTFEQLKHLHERSISVGASLTYLTPFKHTSRNYTQSDGPWQVAMNIVSDHGANIYSYGNLLIKIYINNLVLERTVKELSLGLEIILVIALILNYGCVGIVIYYNKKFEDSNLLPIICGFVGILINSMIIIYPSVVNAFSKRMLNSLWQLVVITIDFEDIRVSHIRSLLLRQIGFFCDNGGLMFTAYGVPITYKTVIKITLWSATLVVVSFSI